MQRSQDMKVNPTDPRTYAGQTARIIVAAEFSDGRLLFALKTAAGTLATAFDTARELREFAARNHPMIDDFQTRRVSTPSCLAI